VTIKYNSAGAQEWLRLYDGPAHLDDFGAAIAVDENGNVYVTGVSFGFPTAEQDYVTIKYDSDGNELWASRYNGPIDNWDEPFAIKLDDPGNVYVTGRSNRSGIWFDFDYLTIKYGNDGVEQWTARFNGGGNDWDEAYDLAIDTNGDVYVTGQSEREPGTAFLDYATVKYDANGTQKWVRLFDGAGQNSDIGVGIELDGLGHVVVAGFTSGPGTVYDYATVQYDLDGNKLWDRVYNSGISFSADVVSDMDIDAAGNIYVTGSSVLDYATVKYDVAGNEQWVRRFGVQGVDDKPTSLVVGASGNVYVTGTSAHNFVTLKYDPLGTLVGNVTYDGPAAGNQADSSFSVAIDAFENIYVTGQSLGSGTGPDIATIKYAQPAVGVEPIVLGPDGVRLGQNHPNPFVGATRIPFEIPAESKGPVTLRVLDVRGRVVDTLHDGTLGAGMHQMQWNAGKNSAGVYFYRLEMEGKSTTRKMMLQR
jgi:hypothetical protein